MSGEEYSAEIGEEINATLVDELFGTEEFQEARQCLESINVPRATLMWVDEHGGPLAQTYVYNQEEYWNA